MLSNNLGKPTKEEDISGPGSPEDCLESMMGRKQGPVVVKPKIGRVQKQTIETTPKGKDFGRQESTVDRGAKIGEGLRLKGPKDNFNPGGKGNSSPGKGSCGNSEGYMDKSPSSRQINEIRKPQGSSNDPQFKTMGQPMSFLGKNTMASMSNMSETPNKGPANPPSSFIQQC
jgi:hypothetical protein